MAFASHFMETYSGVVQRGPFQGLKVSSETSWGGGDIAAKVLGTYEQELFPVVEAVRNKRFDSRRLITCRLKWFVDLKFHVLPPTVFWANRWIIAEIVPSNISTVRLAIARRL